MKIYLLEHNKFSDQLTEKLFQLIVTKIALPFGSAIQKNDKKHVTIKLRPNNFNIKEINVTIDPNSENEKLIFNRKNDVLQINIGDIIIQEVSNLLRTFGFKYKVSNLKDMKRIVTHILSNSVPFRQNLADIKYFERKRKRAVL